MEQSAYPYTGAQGRAGSTPTGSPSASPTSPSSRRRRAGRQRRRRADAGGAGAARPARRGAERGVHADVRGRGVVPAGVPARVGEPRRAPRRLRRARVRGAAAGPPPLLDHQELVGEGVGGAGLLPALPRPQRLRRRHHGLGRRRRSAMIDRPRRRSHVTDVSCEVLVLDVLAWLAVGDVAVVGA